MEAGRKALARSRRIIVKIGSNALADHPELIPALAEEVAELSASGASFLLVSSGAVALGWRRLGYRRRPKEIPQLQASAAAGQSLLMNRYAEAFSVHGLCVAQVLLTHSDLSKRVSLNNARASLGALLDARAVPIVNENDTVSTEEIRFGDNDQLAAMVAPLVNADLLILLSNVEGVLDSDGQRISTFAASEAVFEHRAAVGAQGRGGIQSKVEAARKACRSGARAVVAQAHAPNILRSVLSAACSAERTSGPCSSRGATRSKRASIGSPSRCARAASSWSIPAPCKRCRRARRACCRSACSACAASSILGTPCDCSAPAEKTSPAACRG
jgi:glutamate 5-kinase